MKTCHQTYMMFLTSLREAKRRSNLLTILRLPRQAAAILAGFHRAFFLSAALLALAAQAPVVDAAAITLLAFSQAHEANADFYTRPAARPPRPITLGKRRQLPALLDELAAEVTRRMEDELSLIHI